MTKLTSNEIAGLKGIVDSDYRDGEHPVNHWVWDWSANPFKTKKTFSGVMASLNKKGLAKSEEWDTNEGVIAMTAAGWEALKAADPEFCAREVRVPERTK